MSKKATATIAEGVNIPLIGLGTWLSEPNEVKEAVTHALKHGYRHLDLAKVYGNQHEVAAGIAASGVPRKDIFITSKLWNTWHHPSRVAAGLEDTLKELQTDYLDLYLIHWPVSFSEPPKPASEAEYLFPKAAPTDNEVILDHETSLVDTWKEMIKLKESGKVKAIGVSNFTIEYVEALIKHTGVKPSVNQIERHPLLLQPELVAHHAKQGIHITAYSPLGNNLRGETKIVDYPEVVAIAKKLKVDPAQVLIAWAGRGGISVIPKSVTPSRIESNFHQVDLSDEDYEAISALGKKKEVRFNVPVTYSPVWPINVFNSELERPYKHTVKMV